MSALAWFITGLFTGSTVGVLMMALLCASGRASEAEEMQRLRDQIDLLGNELVKEKVALRSMHPREAVDALARLLRETE